MPTHLKEDLKGADFFKGVLVHLGWAILDRKPPSIPLTWVNASKRIGLCLVPTWRPKAAVVHHKKARKTQKSTPQR